MDVDLMISLLLALGWVMRAPKCKYLPWRCVYSGIKKMDFCCFPGEREFSGIPWIERALGGVFPALAIIIREFLIVILARAAKGRWERGKTVGKLLDLWGMRNAQEFLEMLLPHHRAPHPAGNSFSNRRMGQGGFKSRKRREKRCGALQCGLKIMESSQVSISGWR